MHAIMPRRLLAAAVAAMAVPLAAERLPVRSLTTAEGLPRDQLACAVSDERGFVWFCTAEGLVRFDGHAAVTFGSAEGLTSPEVRTFFIARERRFWAGTAGALFEFRPDPRDG